MNLRINTTATIIYHHQDTSTPPSLPSSSTKYESAIVMSLLVWGHPTIHATPTVQLGRTIGARSRRFNDRRNEFNCAARSHLQDCFDGWSLWGEDNGIGKGEFLFLAQIGMHYQSLLKCVDTHIILLLLHALIDISCHRT